MSHYFVLSHVQGVSWNVKRLVFIFSKHKAMLFTHGYCGVPIAFLWHSCSVSDVCVREVLISTYLNSVVAWYSSVWQGFYFAYLKLSNTNQRNKTGVFDTSFWYANDKSWHTLWYTINQLLAFCDVLSQY